MPLDSLLTLFRTQPIHSKITLTRASLPLAINLTSFGFLIQTTFILLFSTRSEEERKIKKKIEVPNSKYKYN